MAERQVHLAGQIDRILEAEQDLSAPGVAVVIRKDQRIIYSAAKGMADAQLGQPITLDTVFELASVTKPITAVATMQLVQQGRIGLSDPVRQWLPGLPLRWQAVTVHHLLSHQSGVPECCAGISLEQFQRLDGISNTQLISRFSQGHALLFEPGSRASYCNSNYVLLAEIVAAASGIDYRDYIRMNVFAPLGMSASSVGPASPGLTSGHALNYGQGRLVYGISFELLGSSGAHSSVRDLLAFMDGVHADRLIPRSERIRMTSDQSAAPVREKDTLHYGYGWFVRANSSGLSLFGHNGQADGFRSVLSIDLETGVDMVALGNGGKRSEEVMNLIVRAVRRAGLTKQWARSSRT